jgi:hypothetical protein
MPIVHSPSTQLMQFPLDRKTAVETPYAPFVAQSRDKSPAKSAGSDTSGLNYSPIVRARPGH